MKILILANNDIGLYKFRKELIKELLDRGNEVYISLPKGEMINSLIELGCKFVDTPINRRGKNPFKDLLLVIRYQRIIKDIKPDYVITYTIKPNIYGGAVCKRYNIKYAANITGLGSAFQSNSLLKKIVIFLYKIGLKKAKTVFFENQENLNVFVKEKIVDYDRCCLLNGAGVNLADFPKIQYPKEKSTIEFLFIGRVMKEKGVNELFEATKKIYNEGIDCKLTIIGKFEEKYKNIIDKYTKEGWLIYEGFQQDVKPYIKNANCVILPSWHEGMANTNLESAACARPVITSNIHGCMEAIIPNSTGFLCNPKDSNSLYLEMKKFVLLPYEEKKKMGELGRVHMENLFDKNKVVQKTLENL